MRALVDWVGATIPMDDPFYVVEKILGFPVEDFHESAGRRGYRKGLRCGNIEVWFDGSPGMGVHLEASGQGVRQLETRFFREDVSQWATWFDLVLRYGGKFSRLDTAIDDLADSAEGLAFTISQVVAAVKDGLCVSRMRSGMVQEGLSLVDGSTSGQTVYFGSPQSRLRVRMYDKAAERRSKGEAENGEWVRTEVQARDERAQAIAQLLAGGAEVGAVVRGVLANYLRFTNREGTEDSNRSRWSIAPWWAGFLANVESLRLTVDLPEQTVESVRRWMRHQVSASFYLLYMERQLVSPDLGWDEFLSLLLREGAEKMKPRHKAILDRRLEEVERIRAKRASHRAV